MVTDDDLEAVLRHCRALLDAANELDAVLSSRVAEAENVLRVWSGSHARTFAARATDEDTETRGCVVLLHQQADQWAQLWADTVNEINRRRRESAVAELSSSRGFLERGADLLLGDDSGDLTAEFVAVTVPRADQRYAATGELVTY